MAIKYHIDQKKEFNDQLNKIGISGWEFKEDKVSSNQNNKKGETNAEKTNKR